MWMDVDEMARILESGANLVSTAAFITGHGQGDGRRRLAEACERGGSSVFGTGINPGWAELLAMVLASGCDRIDKITVQESADSTLYDSPETELPAGFARPIDDPELPAMTAHGTAVFGEAVRMLGDALGVELDDVVCEAEYAQTTEDLDLGSWKIPAGCVAGIAASWQGRVGGRTVVELNVRWRKGQTLDPDWQLDTGYLIQIDGRPTIRAKVDLPPAGRLPGHDVRRVHGARDDHDVAAGHQRDPRGRGRAARHRHLHRPVRHPAPRLGRLTPRCVSRAPT